MGRRLHEHRGSVELTERQSDPDRAILEIDRAHAELRMAGYKGRRDEKHDDRASGIHRAAWITS